MTEAVASSGWPARGARGAWAAWAGLPDALHAEWTKLRTLSSTWWLLLAAGGGGARPWPRRPGAPRAQAAARRR